MGAACLGVQCEANVPDKQPKIGLTGAIVRKKSESTKNLSPAPVKAGKRPPEVLLFGQPLFCKRYIVYEVRSARKLFNCGVCYHAI
jgi:hypothetical protein